MSNKNSNYPTTAQPKATPAEIGQMVGIMDNMRKLSAVSKREPEKVQERLDYYFQYCTDNGVKPSVEGMCLCLGVSRQSVWEWEQDAQSRSGQLVARAKELINSLLTSWTMDGKVNPVYSIWLQKNNYGYTDNRTIEIKPQTEPHNVNIEQQIEEAGLVWNSQLEEYIPANR